MADLNKKKLRFSINAEPESDTDRRVKLALRPRHKMISFRFHGPDVEQWKLVAEKLGLSDTELIERVMNAVAGEVLRR